MIKRDAFLYLEPKGTNFAQCATCILFLPETKRCKILGKNDIVYPDSSCGLYIHGKPEATGEPTGNVAAQEAGLVHRQVRCENCAAFDRGICALFKDLNGKMPQVFDLNINVKAKGCCNAQHPSAKRDSIGATVRRIKDA